jgi:hypothetical protein
MKGVMATPNLVEPGSELTRDDVRSQVEHEDRVVPLAGDVTARDD